MRGLVVRLMLSVCLAPLVSSLNGVIRAMAGVLGSGSTGEVSQNIATVTVLILAYAYWLTIWFGAVRWTARRRKRTGLAMLCSLLTGVAFVVFYICTTSTYMTTQALWYSPSIFQECQAPAIAVWLLGTTLVWRETAEERGQRMMEAVPAKMRLMGMVHCPNCTYNMTGLSAARCPECGTEYTLEALLAANLEDTDLDVPLRR
jgi:uncharacterized paraquat-inducible protein A